MNFFKLLLNTKKYLLGYRKRIVVSITLLVMFVMVSLTSYGLLSERSILKEDMSEAGSFLVKNLAYNSETGAFSEDDSFLKTPVHAVLAHDNSVWAAVYSLSGSVIYSKSKLKVGIPSFSHEIITELLSNDRNKPSMRVAKLSGVKILDFYTPIYLQSGIGLREEGELGKSDAWEGKEKIGIARVGISTQKIHKKTNKILSMVILLMVLYMIMVFIAAIFITNKISKPIVELTRGAKEIGRGNMDARIKIKTEDEIGYLAKSFNQMARDIQFGVEKLRLSEEEIKQKNEFLENLLESANIIIIEVDKSGIIKRFNRFSVEVFKYTKGEAIGKSFAGLLVPDALREHFSNVIQEPNLYRHYEGKCLTKTGKELTVSWVCSNVYDKSREVIGVLLIGTDVTDKRMMEEQLLRSEKLSSLGEMAGGVAHDFNNVLAAILGRAQLLKLQSHSISASAWSDFKKLLTDGLDIIERASKDGAETVRRIQEFARVRKDDHEFKPVNLNEIIEHAIEFTRSRWKNMCESQGIKVDIIKSLSPVPKVSGSPSELREVFTNLINNALDAMPEGGILTFKTSTESNKVLIEVSDTGVGMPEEIKRKVFDPFFTSKGPQSSGLGMSVSYGIISRHRGTISIETEQGKGTTFTIVLPVVSNAAIKEAQSQSTQADGDTCRGLSQKCNVLVIEDEDEIRTLLYDILTADGHHVTLAKDAKDGIEKFDEHTFDYVFTDLSMQGMSGWDVAEKIKTRNSRVPVVLITGWGSQLQEQQIKEKSIDKVISKPFTVVQIKDTIHQLSTVAQGFG